MQDYIIQSIRTAAILTNSYVAGTIVGNTTNTSHVFRQNELLLYVSFTIGSLTDLRIKIEFSPDNVTYYQETNSGNPSSGVVTDEVYERKYTASGNYRLAIPIKDRYIKISAKGTGTVTSSSCTIDAILGVA